jgi:hypothetical protein
MPESSGEGEPLSSVEKARAESKREPERVCVCVVPTSTLFPRLVSSLCANVVHNTRTVQRKKGYGERSMAERERERERDGAGGERREETELSITLVI